jgi:hypothetical protein
MSVSVSNNDHDLYLICDVSQSSSTFTISDISQSLGEQQASPVVAREIENAGSRI